MEECPNGALAGPRCRGFRASHAADDRAAHRRRQWIRATDAFEQTLSNLPDHPYIGHLRAKPTRRIGLSGIVERLRTAEFPHIERRKAGNRRNAPVFYRIGRPGPGLDLQLPYEVAASHPLLVQRRRT